MVMVMSKLVGKTSLSRRKLKTDTENIQEQKKDRITTVGTRKNITTGISPVTMRLTENDKIELNIWLEELTEEMEKPITGAKLMKGLLDMKDKINKKNLIYSINKAN